MGIVQMTVNLSNDLTTVKVIGKMTADDLRFWVRDFYAGDVTSLVLWDLIKADLTEIEPEVTADEILAHVQQVNEAAAHVRQGGKTAYLVGGNTPALRLCQRLVSFGAEERSPFERRIFTLMDEAMKWLGI